MANVRPGMRIKKVRGEFNIGLTATVSSIYDKTPGDPYTAKAIMDNYGVGYYWLTDKYTTFGAGEAVWIIPDEWEPLKDAFNPAEEREEELVLV